MARSLLWPGQKDPTRRRGGGELAVARPLISTQFPSVRNNLAAARRRRGRRPAVGALRTPLLIPGPAAVDANAPSPRLSGSIPAGPEQLTH
jgi:hypothetical protein